MTETNDLLPNCLRVEAEKLEEFAYKTRYWHAESFDSALRRICRRFLTL
jgi:hypothetical protein